MFGDNRLKARFAEGGKGLGCWLSMASSISAEIVALAGVDFVLLDHEHGSGSLLSAIPLLQAASGAGATTLMRVEWNDPVYIKRALDTGVEGLMIPQVDDAEAARAAVAACRYPPDGVRSVAWGVIRAADWGLRAEEYGARANAEVLVIAQIESPKAVGNVPEIAAVDGIDALFIGPFDLSASMGKPGRFDDPEVADMIGRAEQAILASGKVLGGITRSHDDAKAMFGRGYQMVVAGADVTLLRDAARALVDTYAAK